MVHVRLRDQSTEHLGSSRIHPLQIVEEQHKGMLCSGEHAQEAEKDDLETVLCFLRRQVNHRRLFSDHELQFRNEVNNELAVHSERLSQGIPPSAKLRLTLAQKRADNALEGLHQGGVRNIALVLIKL